MAGIRAAGATPAGGAVLPAASPRGFARRRAALSRSAGVHNRGVSRADARAGTQQATGR